MRGVNHPHIEPPPIPLIQETQNGKSDKDFVKLILLRDHTSSTPDLYEFKIYLFDNGDLEKFLSFVCNFNMTLATSGTLEMAAKYQYICTLVHGETLCQFDSLSSDIEGTQPLLLMILLRVYHSTSPL